LCEVDGVARRYWTMSENRSEGLLVRAEPLGPARRLCLRMVEEVHEADGALLLDADPAWAAAINTVLVKKGLRISELRWAETPERSRDALLVI
jgi:hypothetical protein